MRSLQISSLTVGFVAAALLAGCASQPKVLSDYDKSANFAGYRTFGFVTQVGADSTEFKSLAVQTMQAAATWQMEMRGYTLSDTPDLVINFTGKIEEKADVESKAIMKDAFKLRKDRIDLLDKYAGKLDKKLPSTKVFQFVQVENKIQALLDVAAAASIPIVTKTSNVTK